jgi:A nuclease family of the HNH/ENDO VII superfamily with conserved AHH
VKPNKTKVPLKVEKGVIKTGTEGDYRIVNDKVYPKAVETIPGKPGKILGKLSQIHHMEADNMLRSTPFGQRLLRLGAANPDDALNLIELAKSKQALADARKLHPDVQFSDFIHNTQHPLFDELMQEVVDQRITAVRKAKGLTNLENPEFIPQMTKEDVQAVWIEALTRMRRGLMGEDKALYDRIEKITRPSGSIAQGESQNDTEVA